MATNFTEFTSDASPSGGVVLVGHNIAGTGEIKTTIDQILSAMNLATDSDASFNSLSLSGNVSLSDSATIDVGGGTGDLNITSGKVHIEQDDDKLFIRNSNSYGNLYLGANGTTSTWGGRIMFGASTTLGAGIGVTLIGRRNGSFEVDAASMDIDCDLTTSGDISLSDGATIDVGGGTGEVTIDGDLKLSNSHNTATLQREINITTNTPYGGFVMSNSGNNTRTLTLTTSDSGSRALVIKDFLGNEALFTNIWGNIVSSREISLTGNSGNIKIGGMNESYVKLQVRGTIGHVDTAYFDKITGQSADLTCWRDESQNKKIVIDNDFNLGIGVATPSEALDVDGNFNLSGDIKVTDGANIEIGSGTGDLSFNTDQLFVDGTNERIGIGTASPAAYRLHVNGTSLFTDVLKIGSGGNNQDGELRARTIRLSNDTGNSTAKIFSSGSYDRDLIYHANEHHFTRAGIPRLSITNTEVVFNHSNSHNGWGPDVDFRVEGSGGRTNALVVQGYDGFVGIGVAAPTVELDVLGDAKISGDITQGGNAVLDASYFTPQTLTDGATIAYDVSNGVNAKVTLGGDRTLAAITNAAEGQSGSLTVIQDATGGRALTLDASQTDMLGTLADIAGMGANEECEIAWRKTDATKCKFWITIPA